MKAKIQVFRVVCIVLWVLTIALGALLMWKGNRPDLLPFLAGLAMILPALIVLSCLRTLSMHPIEKAIKAWNAWYKSWCDKFDDFETPDLLEEEDFGSMAIGFLIGQGLDAKTAYDLVREQSPSPIKR